ncbi:DUF4190 domain-containing protein [Streptomyces sp. NPDC048581]|uniref:DUF4190 domain-containing protein n=1 Tax=Streptomyces sp. NPDC048581 TaxID=3365572 RepID=UPI00372128B5
MSTPSDPDPQVNDPNPSLSKSSDAAPPVPPQQAPTHAGWPAYPPYYARPPRTNGLAIASMVLGIVWIYWIGSILALIFGYVARKQIRERHESGDGMATAGIVLGWVGVGVLALLLVGAFISYMSS